MSTHTPGPWHVVDTLASEDDDVMPKIEVLHDRDFVASCDTIEDATLIAKAPIAPKLAEALRVLTEHAQETYPHFESERGQRDIAAAVAALAEWDNAK